MARANRHFLPGHVWHITHRCHERDFLFKFARDRNRYLRWLYEARKRFGLCILNYVVTSNHIHLLVKDTEEGVIARSMQLAAGRTAQDYNRRKSRLGAFWEDRYHATAIQTDAHHGGTGCGSIQAPNRRARTTQIISHVPKPESL